VLMGDLNRWWCIHEGQGEDSIHIMSPIDPWINQYAFVKNILAKALFDRKGRGEDEEQRPSSIGREEGGSTHFTSGVDSDGGELVWNLMYRWS